MRQEEIAAIVHMMRTAERKGPLVLKAFLKIVHRKASKGDTAYMEALRVWQESRQLGRRLLRGVAGVGALVLGLVLFVGPAEAELDYLDQQPYGQGVCVVSTPINLLTDVKAVGLSCSDRRGMYFSISYYPKGAMQFVTGWSLGLSAGYQYDPSPTILTSVRVYPGPLMTRRANWAGGRFAHIYDQQFISSLLAQLTKGGKMVIQVGVKSGVINLPPDMAQAVQDFQRRLSALGQQTLEIPQQPTF